LLLCLEEGLLHQQSYIWVLIELRRILHIYLMTLVRTKAHKLQRVDQWLVSTPWCQNIEDEYNPNRVLHKLMFCLCSIWVNDITILVLICWLNRQGWRELRSCPVIRKSNLQTWLWWHY
jgi:hypothetical protein